MNLNHTQGIYKIWNTKTGDFYIGKTNNIHARWKAHMRKLRLGIHENIHLQRAWDKYGCREFCFTVIEFVDSTEELATKEQSYISKMKPPYNILDVSGVGRTGIPHTAEARAKISKARTGMKFSDETRKRISESKKGNTIRRGIKQTPEHIAKLSALRKGKKPSEETRMKMSKANAGRVPLNKGLT